METMMRIRAVLTALCLALLMIVPAAAQQKRVGLVIGIGDYPNVPHPTATHDAALVAQALQQSGFDLVQAANPDQAIFRQRFREFLDKAHAAGPDAVIAVYLAGFGLQDDGENLLIPAQARITMRPDFATEALRLNDFLRAMQAMPSQKRLVFIDAAYQSPYLSVLPDGGRGLSEPERVAGTLIALNTAPGRVAALPQTNYGNFAMALAEALAEPGLDVVAAMERVRLRVHDLSKGAETPFAQSGLAQNIVLSTASVGVAPPVAPPAPPRAITTEPSAEESYARAVQIDTLAAYRDFLRAYPDHPLAKRVRATIAQRREAAYWAQTRRENSERGYWTYLKHYPRGPHAGEARRRLDRMQASLAPPAAFDEVIYEDLPPPLPEERVVYEQIVIVEEEWEPLPSSYAMPVALLPPPPVAIIEAPPPSRPFSPYLLPAVPLAIGAGILAHRAWVRPRDVRPAWVPPPHPRGPIVPVVAPGTPRPPGPPPGGIVPLPPPVTQPPVGLAPNMPGPRGPVVPPGAVRRPVPNVIPQPGIQPPNVATPTQPGVTPPVVTPPVARPPGLRPTVPGQTLPGQVQPGQTVPGQPTQPPNTRPGQPPVPNIAVPSPTRPTPPGGGVQRPDPRLSEPVKERRPRNADQRQPDGRPVVVMPPAGTVRPGIQPPGTQPPVMRQPPIARPDPRSPDVRGPAGYRPPPPGYRPPLNSGVNPPSTRPAPPILREPQPQMRQPQQPVMRQPPPMARPTPPQAPQPVFRPVPQQQPQARPQQQPQRQQLQCTPQMRASRMC